MKTRARTRTRFARSGESPRRRVRAAVEAVFVAAVATAGAALFWGLVWLYSALTPPQASAECEWLRAEMEAAQCPE